MDPYQILASTDAEPGPSAVLTFIGFIIIGLLVDILILKVLFIVGSAIKPHIFTFINWSRHALSVLWNPEIPFPLVVLIIAATCSLQFLLFRQWYRALPA